MLTLIPIPAFADNYLWLLHDGQRALVVDPGDAAPVQRVLQDNGLQLSTILVTHHHADHTGGVDTLRDETGAKVFGPASENIPKPFTPLREGDSVNAMGLNFQVIDVPGHTSGHIAYYAAPTLLASPLFENTLCHTLPPEGAGLVRDGPALQPTSNMKVRPLLFCGDTLFSGGCGRLFEGTPAQMLASLDKLAALPGNTVTCCTHEYTLSNLRFAVAVDPDNQTLASYQAHCEKLREQHQPTLPTSIAQELLINPFLRTRQPALISSAQQFDAAAHDDVSVFAAIRQWKNQFK